MNNSKKEKFTNFINSSVIDNSVYNKSNSIDNDAVYRINHSNGDIDLNIPDGNGGRSSVKVSNAINTTGGFGQYVHKVDTTPQHYIGDFPPQQFNDPNIYIPSTQPWITPYPTDPNQVGIGGNGGWGNVIRKKTIDIDGDINVNGIPITDEMKKMKEKISELEKKIPNKIDKDLIDTKVPYNIKKDVHGTLIYEICAAGFRSEELILDIKGNNIYLTGKINDDDDLIGDEFEFLCKGIKPELKVDFFIDLDMYDKTKIECELSRGLLKLYIPLKVEMKEKLSVKEKKEKGKVKVNI